MARVLVFKYLLPKRFDGLTLWPFIILKNKLLKEDVKLVNHELIHIKQQQELLVLFFYIWYLVEWVIRLAQFKNIKLAYYNISFEREAYANEHNINYIKERSLWAFTKYI